MTQLSPTPRSDNGISILAWILYILAVVTLTLGVYTGISLINFPSVMQGLGPVIGALGGGPLVELLTRSLSSALVSGGVFVIIVSLAISTLLFASGKLWYTPPHP